MFQTKVAQKIKHILCSINYFQKTFPFMRSKMEKYGRARQATDNLIRRMSFGCWVNTARIQTHS